MAVVVVKTAVEVVSQLKLAIVPVWAVRYCRQFSSGALRSPHSYCVTLMLQDLVVAVVAVSISMVRVTQEGQAGTNMCCPVL